MFEGKSLLCAERIILGSSFHRLPIDFRPCVTPLSACLIIYTDVSFVDGFLGFPMRVQDVSEERRNNFKKQISSIVCRNAVNKHNAHDAVKLSKLQQCVTRSFNNLK